MLRDWGRKRGAFGSREDTLPGTTGFCSASVVNLAISVLGTMFGPELVAEGDDDLGEDILEDEDTVVVIAGWKEGRDLVGTV